MYIVVFGVGVRGATKRSLLIGISLYNPSAAESEVLKRITAEPHKSDSRFALGYEWAGSLAGSTADFE